MELRERGLSVSAAAREVGVLRSAGNNWTHGCKTLRRGEVVWVMAPLDCLAVRKVRGRYLSQDERFEIAELRQARSSLREVARLLGRAPSTVSRKLSRNTCVPSRGGYRAFEAHRRAC